MFGFFLGRKGCLSGGELENEVKCVFLGGRGGRGLLALKRKKLHFTSPLGERAFFCLVL